MLTALILAAALGDCIKPAAKPIVPAIHVTPNVHRKARKRSLIKPPEPNCDEISTSIVELFVIPPEVPPEMLYTPAPEMVETWPVDEPVTPMPAELCECFARFIGGASEGGSSSGGGFVRVGPVFASVAPIPEPSIWALLLAGVAVGSYRRFRNNLKRTA